MRRELGFGRLYHGCATGWIDTRPRNRRHPTSLSRSVKNNDHWSL
ncbi:hypothetical protein I550_3987 [Mycobacterium intracellulare 1956]|uniref:Uncharacterized protein n=1 Tax=Mycobacterium intracellulare 1956 TaxID=1299331 RepID=X8CKS6_MYCIT|nr:hypothetical protein I550_3987 [Mycobacterium intracellulare 1956]